MPLATALRLCPQARVVPVDFGAYRAASTQVFALARTYTPVVEPLSLDEAYLDVTASQRRFGAPRSIAAELRDRILDTTRLHASFGVATAKVVAKVASDLRKPRGLVVVEPGEEAAFLAPQALRTLPGLGPAAERALQGLGVSTLGQLAALPLDVLQRRSVRRPDACSGSGPAVTTTRRSAFPAVPRASPARRRSPTTSMTTTRSTRACRSSPPMSVAGFAREAGAPER